MDRNEIERKESKSINQYISLLFHWILSENAKKKNDVPKQSLTCFNDNYWDLYYWNNNNYIIKKNKLF